jgi:hypothetical protein
VHRTTLLTLAVVLIWIGSALTARGQDKIPFTPTEIAASLGKDICSFGEQFPKQEGVFLDSANQHAIEYREHDGIIGVFLLSKPTTHCGIVDARLNLTPQIRKGETVEFKCYTNREGGTTPGKWGHIIGLANNHSGQKRFVKARLAWRVDIENKRFEPITGEVVQCDTSGYTD